MLAHELWIQGFSRRQYSARHFKRRMLGQLGFVRLPSRAPFEITPAGRALIADEETEDLFLRQLLKWQIPSPNHNGQDYRELFRIKPFLEVLRLARDLDGINKDELALYGVPLIDWRDYEQALEGIRGLRQRLQQATNRAARKALVKAAYLSRMREVYADDIAQGRTGTREGGGDATLDRFLKTKAASARDYADAAMRYFLKTGLFSISRSGRVFKLRVLPERLEEADILLANTPREPESYENAEVFYQRLGDPSQPALPSDQVPVLQNQLKTLLEDVPVSVVQHTGADPASTSPVDLKIMIRRVQAEAEALATQAQLDRLTTPEGVDDILEVFDQIKAGETIDGPLYLEWNTWRALVALDDGRIQNNFQMDRFGLPKTLAPGKGPDIVCEYAQKHLAVEVTLTKGQTQYKAEGEPVNRHVGLLQKQVQEAGDDRPVFGLFIAPSIASTVTAHFYGLYKFKTREFGGTVQVVPLTMGQFAGMVRAARNHVPISADHLKSFLLAVQKAADEAEDEVDWKEKVDALVVAWPSQFETAA